MGLISYSNMMIHQRLEDEWDEIEDIGSSDESKDKVVSHGSSPNRAQLHKRMSVAQEEEDLTWDIEDDDEPAQA
ncbi:hypothetical protein L6452_18439 [Arctium lappa]|uniref:Uncharacterized protein n=1 Tax=Arctium lappa TaxID=4217 RepID=A0ACB9C675_ARCLA|nr:hypothetical protein L6452_18439 [Arctium lappa]